MVFKRLMDKIWSFIKARGWQEHQKPRSLAISIVLESAELLEHFQWVDDEEFYKQYKKDSKQKQEVADEIADVLIYTLTLCKVLDLDPEEIIEDKIAKNAKKYPVD